MALIIDDGVITDALDPVLPSDRDRDRPRCSHGSEGAIGMTTESAASGHDDGAARPPRYW